MNTKLFSLAFSLVLLVTVACGDDGKDQDPCEGITCSSHGICVNAGGNLSCDCEDGYIANGLQCIASTGPCASVTCGGHGACLTEGDLASCECNEGYHAQGLWCLPDADPCEGVACSEHGDCVADGVQSSCSCDQGYRAVDLECVRPDTATIMETDIHAATGGQERVNLREMTHGDDLADYDFIVAMNPSVGPVIMLGLGVSAQNLGNESDYHEVDEAPMSGYQADTGSTLVIGTTWRDDGSGSTGFHMTENVYVLKLADGTFGKIEVLGALNGAIDVMCYHQPNGTRIIVTMPE